MFRRIWHKFEPWLTRASHFDLLVVKTGLGALFLSGLSGLFTGILAWWHQTPVYQVVLAAMIGMGAVLFIANQGIRLVTASKLPASISRQQARRLDKINLGGIDQAAMCLVITMLSSALIIVAGIAITNWYFSWRSDIENTYLELVPRNITMNVSNSNHPFMVTLLGINPGNLIIAGTAMTYKFEYPERELNAGDENLQFKSMDAMLPDPKNFRGLRFSAHRKRFFHGRRLNNSTIANSKNSSLMP